MRRKIMSRGKCVLLTTIVALAVANTASAATENTIETESRNAATGFAITTSLVVLQSLGKGCGEYESEVGREAQAAFSGWQQRNMAYLDGAVARLLALTDGVSKQYGAEEGRKFAAARKEEFNGSAYKAVLQMFPGGESTPETCKRMSEAVQDGIYDLDRHAEFSPVLKAMQVQAKQDLGSKP